MLNIFFTGITFFYYIFIFCNLSGSKQCGVYSQKLNKNDHITVLLRKLDINGYLPFKTRLLLPTSQLVILSFHVMDLQN